MRLYQPLDSSWILGCLLALAACADESSSGSLRDFQGVYTVEERMVSTSCDPADLEASDTPTHVELLTESGTIMLYPCERIVDGRCHAFDASKYPVGEVSRPVEGGYETEILSFHGGTASCFAGYVRSSVRDVAEAVYIEDLRRGGIVPDVAPADCTREAIPPPEELPCMWYEELILSPLP